MGKFIVFAILSLFVIYASWRTLFNVKSHGFYRFFSWEAIAWVFASNYHYWTSDPFSPAQIVSWILLILSAYLVLDGMYRLLKQGKPKPIRQEPNLFGFEKTTELIDTGVFKYIRHPLYSSLIYLNWGIFLKHMTLELFIISVISTVLLYITSSRDEKECIVYFGKTYTDYMKRSKMFVPFLF